MARGGYRPGAGRKPKNSNTQSPKKPKKGEGKKQAPTVPADIAAEALAENTTPLDYMLKVMRDPAVEKERRDRMAVCAAPFCHARKGEGAGKKEEKEDRAKKAGAGRFAPSAPPLKVVK